MKSLKKWIDEDYWPKESKKQIVFPKTTRKQAVDFLKKLKPDESTRKKIIDYYKYYPKSTPNNFIPRPQDPIRVLRNERYLEQETKERLNKGAKAIKKLDTTWPSFADNPLNKKVTDAFNPSLSHWFNSTEIVESKESISLKAPNEFIKEWIEGHYLEKIKTLFDKEVIIIL